MPHRSRELLIRHRTILINALWAHLSKFGLIARQGWSGVEMLLAYVEDDEIDIVPASARSALSLLVDQLRDLQGEQVKLDAEILQWHQGSVEGHRLATVPSIDPITASAIAATMPDPGVFESGRQMAAWMGLVQRQRFSGGKERFGRITEKGDPYVRKLLVFGTHAVLRNAKTRRGVLHEWAMRLHERRPI